MSSAKPPRSTGKKILASVAVLAAVGAFMSFGVFSLFSATKSNSSSLTTATFALTQFPDVGGLFDTLTGLLPNDTITRCVKLTNDGNTGITVDATPTITNASNLSVSPTMTIAEVTGVATDTAANVKNCVDAGSGISVVSSRTYLSNASGSGLTTQHLLSGSSGTGTSWAAGESHIYRIAVTIPSGLDVSTDTNKSVTPGVSFVASQVAGSAK